jgi:paraquat-inducible protein B
MTTDTSEPAAATALPQARVVKRERWSIVWLIPLTALIIGAWLAYHAISQRGPTITIEFATASGLQAGKTKVKFKEVTIGQVTDIALSEDLETVLVTAELTQGAARYLTRETQFWVARPRVTASQVSGLETLLSGAYVAIDPVLKGKPARHFVGLTNPPVITTSEPGAQFSLRAPSLGSLNLGSPVYYRRIQVGQVVDYQLDADGSAVTIDVFITKPHDRLVYSTTRFWNASGIDLRLNADGISLDTESLLAIMIGGLAFDTPDTLDGRGAPAPAGQYFPLYANRTRAYERAYLNKMRFVLLFEGSVRGLSRQAPVMVRGIEVGRVLDVKLEFDAQRLDFQVPVLIEIEPERIDAVGQDKSQQPLPQAGQLQQMSALVANGLRAQLKTGSLLTGQLYVDFDLHPQAKPAEITERAGYHVLPTLPTPLEAVTTKVSRILDEVESIPFRQLGEELTGILQGVQTILDTPETQQLPVQVEQLLGQLTQLTTALEQQLTPELIALTNRAEGVVEHFDHLLAPEAPLNTETLRALRELQSAARSVRVLADYLERHPEALLKGKGGVR